MPDVQLLPEVAIPPEDGTFGFILTYHGEPAYSIEIENVPTEQRVAQADQVGHDTKKIVSSKLSVCTWPLLGGDGERVDINLTFEGKE